MGRGLSTAAKDYTGPVLWAAEIRLPGYIGYGEGGYGEGGYGGGTVKYYATDALTFLGVAYAAYLRIVSGVRRTRSLVPDDATIELLNADLAIGALLEADAFEGGECRLYQLLLGIDERVEILRGRLHEQEETEEAVRFRLVSELDPAQRQAMLRPYMQLCPWRFRKKPCGYDEANVSFVENLAERTADIFSFTTIGDTTLAMSVDAHKDRVVVITAGTGKGQKRIIKSNTATTLTLRGRFTTKPDGTSKFKVFTFTLGAPRLLFTATTGKLETTATSGAARSITDSGLAMTVDEHAGEIVRITAGAGAGQQRQIGSNTATAITLDAAESDFSPAPDSTSVFRVLYRTCPKAYSPDCEERARTLDFGGFPTITTGLRKAFQPFELGGGDDGGDGGVEP